MNDRFDNKTKDELKQKAWLVQHELQHAARRRRGCLSEEVIIGAAMQRFPRLHHPRAMWHIRSCVDCRESYRLHRGIHQFVSAGESAAPQNAPRSFISLPRLATVVVALLFVGWVAPHIKNTLLQSIPELTNLRREIARLNARYDELWKNVEGENLFRVDCAPVEGGNPFSVSVSFAPTVERFRLINQVQVSWGDDDEAPHETVFSRTINDSRFVAIHDYSGARPGDTFLVRVFIDVTDELSGAMELSTRELEKTFRVTITSAGATVSTATPAVMAVQASEAGGLEWQGRYDEPLPWQTTLSVRATRDTARLTLLVRPVSSATAYVMAGSGPLRAGGIRDYAVVLGGGPDAYAGEQLEVLLVEADDFRPMNWSIPIDEVPSDRVALRTTVRKVAAPGSEQHQPEPPMLPSGRIVSPLDGAELDTAVSVTAEIDAEDLDGRQPYFLIQPHPAPGMYFVQNVPANLKAKDGRTVFSATCYLGEPGKDAGQGFDIVLILAERGRFQAGHMLAPLPADTPPVGLVTVHKK